MKLSEEVLKDRIVGSILGVFIGVTITLISLAYTGWSYTADSTLSKSQSTTTAEEQESATSASREGGRKVGGIVANDYGATGNEDEEQVQDEMEDIPDTFSNNWKLNLVLGTVSCWFSMAITAWGSIEDEGDAANPQVGKVSMWIIIGSQWLCLTVYLWTLVAPRLFPDRDFSGVALLNQFLDLVNQLIPFHFDLVDGRLPLGHRVSLIF